MRNPQRIPSTSKANALNPSSTTSQTPSVLSKTLKGSWKHQRSLLLGLSGWWIRLGHDIKRPFAERSRQVDAPGAFRFGNLDHVFISFFLKKKEEGRPSNHNIDPICKYDEWTGGGALASSGEGRHFEGSPEILDCVHHFLSTCRPYHHRSLTPSLSVCQSL